MSLPYVVEYLLSLERPGGGRLVMVGAVQILTIGFPPNFRVTLTVTPMAGDYAIIPYYGHWGPSTVPQAFYGWVQHWGNKQYDAIIGSWGMSNSIDSFVFVTEAEPAMVQIFNQSPLFQQVEWVTHFLRIKSEGDYNMVLQTLKKLPGGA